MVQIDYILLNVGVIRPSLMRWQHFLDQNVLRIFLDKELPLKKSDFFNPIITNLILTFLVTVAFVNKQPFFLTDGQCWIDMNRRMEGLHIA